jgi:hypothetical protein
MSEKYTLENILEMLNGVDNGFSYEQIYFIYHSLNGNEEKAEQYKQLCLNEANKLNRSIQQLKSPDEIVEIKVIEDINNLNIYNTAINE